MIRRGEDGRDADHAGAAARSAAGRGTGSGRAREADAGSMGEREKKEVFVWTVSEASQLVVFRVGTLR